MTPAPQPDHWLVRPKTIRRLWITFGVLLLVTIAAQWLIDIKGYFGIDGWIGFAAAFGFLSCVAMVLIARALGWFLKRRESYYDD